MAVSTKTLTPTGQVVSIPDMTEKPNASVLTDGIGKEADAINALDSKIQTLDVAITSPTFSKSSAGVYYYDQNYTLPTGYKPIAISVISWQQMSGMIYATLYGQTTIELLANSDVSVSTITVRIVFLRVNQ
jgi:hypothetical protein